MGKELTPEQRERRNASKRRYYAKKKAEKIALTEPTPNEEEVPVELAEPDKPSLREKILGKITTPVGVGSEKTAKGKRGKQIDKNLLTQLSPMLVASFVATYSRQMIPDPYKACAPTQEEVTAIIKPYFNILSRYVEITGHASENLIDIIGSIVAATMFGTRSYMTYAQITEHMRRQANGPTQPTSGTTSTNRNPTEQRNTEEINGTARDSSGESTSVGLGASNAENGHSGSRDSDARLLADLFSRDINGRKQLGLF